LTGEIRTTGDFLSALFEPPVPVSSEEGSYGSR
jgi:hypothetical protein